MSTKTADTSIQERQDHVSARSKNVASKGEEKIKAKDSSIPEKSSDARRKFRRKRERDAAGLLKNDHQ